MDLNSLMPTQAANIQRKEAAGLVNKWQKTGLLEGLSHEYEKSGMAVLLENQAKQLVSEANSTGTASNSEEWSGVALPLVRRIFAEIAAKDFVSVQPMNLPSGLVFFLDFKYGTAQPGFETGAGKDVQTDSVFGITDDDKGASVATEGLYGAGRFGYTINEAETATLEDGSGTGFQTGSAAAGGAFVNKAAMTQAGLEFATNFDSAFSASLGGANLNLFTILRAGTGSMTNPDLKGVRAFTVSGSGISTFFPQFTKVSGDSVEFLIKKTAEVPTTFDAVVKYQKAPTDVTRGDFEDSTAAGSGAVSTLDIPEINLEMRSEAIVAKTRKLKAVWTPEFAQDLNAYHSIDAEAELTSMLSEYVSQEIDLEILDMVIQNAQTVDRWSARVGMEYDGSGAFVNQLMHHHLHTTKVLGSKL